MYSYPSVDDEGGKGEGTPKYCFVLLCCIFVNDRKQRLRLMPRTLSGTQFSRCKLFTASIQHTLHLQFLIKALSPKALPVSHHSFLTLSGIIHSDVKVLPHHMQLPGSPARFLNCPVTCGFQCWLHPRWFEVDGGFLLVCSGDTCPP